MENGDSLSPGDEWPDHYRGFSLQINPNGDVWWQLYQGTDRLKLDSFPADLIDTFLEVKPLGGRIHVTEDGDVLTRVEDSDDEYVEAYVGEAELTGELVPPENPEYRVALRPEELEPGDLWPSVYDGSRYSFVGERVWWQDGSSHRRHVVDGELPGNIMQTLRRYKSDGGSFRVLPWGDVITLVPTHPAPGAVREQFGELPRVVQNIIKLRKERDVEMLPIYIGNMSETSIEVTEPRSLTDDLSEEEQEALASWASSLGTTSKTSTSAHRAQTPGSEGEQDTEGEAGGEGDGESEQTDDLPRFDDDPVEWMEEDIEQNRR